MPDDAFAIRPAESTQVVAVTNVSNAARVLECYPPPFCRATCTAHGEPGFSGALVFRVDSAAGPYALRGWPIDSLPPARIQVLHELVSHAHRHGVTQLPVPIAANDGSTLVFVEERHWQLEPWMPGQADFHARPSDLRLTAAMKCLAAFHRAAACFDPSPKLGALHWFFRHDQAPSPAVLARRASILRWFGDDRERLRFELARAEQDEFTRVAEEFFTLFLLIAPRVAEELAHAATASYRLHPCLRDVWHDHILFTEDAVTGLIDPSACRSDNVAIDLSRLLGSLVGNDRAAWNRALDAYSRERPLAENERRLIDVLDRSGVLLSGIRWLERRCLLRERFLRPHRVVARLERFLTRLRHFVRDE